MRRGTWRRNDYVLSTYFFDFKNLKYNDILKQFLPISLSIKWTLIFKIYNLYVDKLSRKFAVRCIFSVIIYF